MTRHLNVTYQCVLCRLPIFEAPPLRLSVSVAGGGKKCTWSKGVLPCQAMPHTSSGSVKVEQKWKQPQYLALNHVLSPFHTQGDSQHRNIVDLHMGDVTGRE